MAKTPSEPKEIAIPYARIRGVLHPLTNDFVGKIDQHLFSRSQSSLFLEDEQFWDTEKKSRLQKSEFEMPPKEVFDRRGAELVRGIQRRVSGIRFVDEFVTTFRRVVMVGGAGTGKSYFVNWLYLGLAMRSQKMRSVPGTANLPAGSLSAFRLSCREIDPRDKRDGTAEWLLRYFEEVSYKPHVENRQDCDPDTMRKGMNEGQAILLLDGLDELCDPIQQEKVVVALMSISKTYPMSRIVLTSRELDSASAWDDCLDTSTPLCKLISQTNQQCSDDQLAMPTFAGIRLSGVNRDDQVPFVEKWLVSAKTPTKMDYRPFIDFGQDASNSPWPSTVDLASNPMLLSTLMIAWDRIRAYPFGLADYCRESFNVLLHWRSEIDRPPRGPRPFAWLGALASIAISDRAIPEKVAISRLESLAVTEAELCFPTGHTPASFLRIMTNRTVLRRSMGSNDEIGYEFSHDILRQYLHANFLRRPDRTELNGAEDCERIAKSLVEWIYEQYKEKSIRGYNQSFANIDREELKVLLLALAICETSLERAAVVSAMLRQPSSGENTVEQVHVIALAECTPNIATPTEELTNQVLARFVKIATKEDFLGTFVLRNEAMCGRLPGTPWAKVAIRLNDNADYGDLLRRLLLNFYMDTLNEDAAIAYSCLADKRRVWVDWHTRAAEIRSPEPGVSLSASLLVMVRAFAVCVYGGIAQLPSDEKVIREIVSALLDALNGDSNAVALAAACALGWLANVQNPPSRKTAKLRNWRPRETDLEPIIRYVTNHSGNLETKRWCVTILGGLREDWDNDVDKLQDSLTPPFVVELLRSLLDFTEKSGLEQVAARTLCRLGWSDPHCVPHLITYLMDTTTDHNLRCEAAEFLGCIGGSAAVSALMATALGNGNPESVRESSFLAFVRLADASALSQFIERSVEDDKWHKRASQILEDLPG